MACRATIRVRNSSRLSRNNGARAEIRVQAFAFSWRPIAAALKAAHDRGIDVQVVVDRSNEGFRGGVTDGLAAAGIPVFIDWSPAIAHSKVMIVDWHLVIGGSFNYAPLPIAGTPKT